MGRQKVQKQVRTEEQNSRGPAKINEKESIKLERTAKDSLIYLEDISIIHNYLSRTSVKYNFVSINWNVKINQNKYQFEVKYNFFLISLCNSMYVVCVPRRLLYLVPSI